MSIASYLEVRYCHACMAGVGVPTSGRSSCWMDGELREYTPLNRGGIAAILLLEKRDGWKGMSLWRSIEELGKAIGLGEDGELKLELEPIKAIEDIHGA